MSTTMTPTRLNGWDLDGMQAAIDGIADNPEAGALTWRSRVTWDAGFGLDVRTESIEQLGERMPRAFTVRSDHPPELLGSNTGPTAIEIVVAALGACITGTYAAQATARGVALHGLEVDLTTMIDLNGFFGIDEQVRPGLQGVTATFRVQADADDETLAEIAEAVTRLSPVHDTLVHPVDVSALRRAGVTTVAAHPGSADPAAVVTAFQQVFDAHDVDGAMALMTDDCLFEDTAPPDGVRHRGQAAVRARWEALFHDAPAARFTTEETVVAGDHVIVRWRYRWGDGHVRGVDLFLVRGDRIAEKRSYVKG